jgi:Xaa-Pro aminopeptidase
MSEIEVSQFMQNEIEVRKINPAWEYAHCPTVNAGPYSPIGHVLPTDLKISKGEIVHIDFGVRLEGYCSDIQRVIYLLGNEEKEPPSPVQRGFDTIVEAIQKTVNSIKPGMMGYEIDQITRNHIIDSGYPEYMYATGHQLGRLAHDGAGIIGPLWERYGDTPRYEIEAGQVYTIEPGIMIPNYGYCGLEEDILITNEGAVFLGTPQTTLMVK